MEKNMEICPRVEKNIEHDMETVGPFERVYMDIEDGLPSALSV